MLKGVNKALLIPIVSFVALIVKNSTGYELNNEAVNLAVDAILAINTIIGIFLEPKRKVIPVDESK